MSDVHTISIAKDFSKFPAGRLLDDGPYPGERFRKKHLVPALNKGGRVVVDLDGVLGFGSSFLEEAFGGLVRREGFAKDDLRSRLELKSNEDPTAPTEIWKYIDDAEPGT